MADLAEAPAHMRLLADWIDAKYPDDGNPQAQQDLRKWADDLEQLLAQPAVRAIRTTWATALRSTQNDGSSHE